MSSAQWALTSAPQAASAGRALVRDTCQLWGLHTVCDDAELVVSELVGNAVRYGGDEIVLSLNQEVESLRVGVYDGGPHLADLSLDVAPLPDVDAEFGRGLYIVQALARAVTVTPQGTGKIVSAWLPIAG